MEINTSERTKCEVCGKWAIKQSTGLVLMSYPPQFPMEWKCACGWAMGAGVVRGKTNEELFLDEWNNAQDS